MLQLLLMAGLVHLSACAAPVQAATEPPQQAVPAQQVGIAVYGRQVPLLIERYLDDAYGEQMEEENRWELVKRIVALVEECAPRPGLGPGEPIDFTLIFDPQPEREGDRERAVAALGSLEQRGFFDLLDQLARARHVARPAQEGDMIGWLLPELGGFRQAARAAKARMFLAAKAGDEAAVARAFEQMMALSRIASHEPTLIGQLVSVAIVSLALNTMSEHIMTRKPSAQSLHMLQAAMERQLPLLPMALGFEGERLFGLDFVRMVYADPEKSPVEVIYSLEHPDKKLDKGAVALFELFYGKLAPRKEVEALLEAWYARWLAMAREMSRASLEAAKEFSGEVEDLPKRYAVAGIIVPANDRALEARLMADAWIAGRRIMLAVELYKREQGQYPLELADLVPRYLTEMPRDPYSGESFIYRPSAPAENERGRGYVLYSVGRDGEDNSGRLHEDGAYVAGQEGGAGFDLVINEPVK